MAKEISIKDRIQRAVVAHHKGQFKLARKSMEQSLRRARKRGVKEEIEVLKIFAFMYYERNEFDKSREYFNHALQYMNQDIQWDRERATIYSVLGLMANKEKNSAEADRLDKLALDYCEKSAYEGIKPELYTSLATRAFEEDRTSDAILFYEQSLAEMQKDHIEQYKQQIKQAEEILVFLYGKAGKKDDRNKLRKRLLAKKIEEHITEVKLQTLPVQPQPPDWALDTLGYFLETASRNIEASFVVHKTLYQSLLYKDAQFRLMDDVIARYIAKRVKDKYPGQPIKELKTLDADALEIYFFQQAHSSFLAATKLALSGQIPQTQMVLRGLLENSMYCFLIHHNQQLKSIWLNRAQDIDSVRENFTVRKIWKAFKLHAPQLYDKINQQYNKTVDDGAHPNVNAFLQHSAYENKEGYLNFRLNYLNPTEIENCLKDVEAAVETSLDVFDLIFDSIN